MIQSNRRRRIKNNLNLKFSLILVGIFIWTCVYHCNCRFKSSGMWRHVVGRSRILEYLAELLWGLKIPHHLVSLHKKPRRFGNSFIFLLQMERIWRNSWSVWPLVLNYSRILIPEHFAVAILLIFWHRMRTTINRVEGFGSLVPNKLRQSKHGCDVSTGTFLLSFPIHANFYSHFKHKYVSNVFK